jgi:hypothetical protein
VTRASTVKVVIVAVVAFLLLTLVASIAGMNVQLP